VQLLSEAAACCILKPREPAPGPLIKRTRKTIEFLRKNAANAASGPRPIHVDLLFGL